MTTATAATPPTTTTTATTAPAKAAPSTAAPSKAARVIAYVVSGLACANLLWSAGIKLVAPPGIAEHFAELGWSMPYATRLGVLEAVCTVLYLVPRTSVLGAVLLTAYLGGATATHARLGDPVAFFPVVLAVCLWAGLFLRDARLRALLPITR